MKRLFALLAACAVLLCAGAAMAAGWAEGRSAAQPYPGIPEVDLDATMGYMLMYPRARLPEDRFCSTLKIYLPREDIAAGSGRLTLYAGGDGAQASEVESVSFEDREAVEIRPLTGEELDDLIWGGGTCIEVRLPVSLRFDRDYYVLMEQGCFTAANGSVESPAIESPQAWTPVLRGDFGVAGLYYSAGQGPVRTPVPIYGGEAGEATPEPTPQPTAAPPGEPVIKLYPSEGDFITFDVVIGGDAKAAVLYSENDSVLFAQPEYNETTTVHGTVLMPNIQLGVVFLDEGGLVVDTIDLAR